MNGIRSDQDIPYYQSHPHKEAPKNGYAWENKIPKVYLTLKGDKHKNNPKYTDPKFKRYIVQ